MVVCAVYKCGNRTEKKIHGISFHRIPKEEVLRQKWVTAIKANAVGRRVNFQPSKHTGICSAHFTEDKLDRTSNCLVRLREGAVPTVFPNLIADQQNELSSKMDIEATGTGDEIMTVKIKEEPMDFCDEFVNYSDNLDLVGLEVKLEELAEDQNNESVSSECENVDMVVQVKIEELDEEIDNNSSENAEELEATNNKCEHECILCEICEKSFSSRSELKIHHLLHLDQNNYSSHMGQISEMGQKSHMDQNSHLGQKLPHMDQNLSDMGQKLEMGQNSEMSQKSHMGQNSHLDQESYMSQEMLNMVQNLSHVDQNIHMTQSSNMGQNAQNMVQKSQMAQKSHKCDLCNKFFSKKSNLKTHLKIHQELPKNQESEFKCFECGKEFRQKGGLTNHAKIHSDLKPWVCEVCSKTFTFPWDLKRHFRTHCDEKAFPCKFCEREFNDRSNLSTHILRFHPDEGEVRPNEKKYECQTCHKIYRSQSGLNQHSCIICDLCERHFSDRTNLRRHISATHLGEKPFSCLDCGRSYSQKSQLKIHLSRSQCCGDRPYDECINREIEPT